MEDSSIGQKSEARSLLPTVDEITDLVRPPISLISQVLRFDAGFVPFRAVELSETMWPAV